jgi:hypothetical protein
MTTIEPTRGERNNNPGNMQPGGWRGELGLELVPPGATFTPRFARFDTPANGVRAIAKQLLVYQQKHGLHTPRAWAFRWAPPTDGNDSEAYAANLAAHMAVGVDQPADLTTGENLANAVFGVIRQENGRVLYETELIDAVCKLAIAG